MKSDDLRLPVRALFPLSCKSTKLLLVFGGLSCCARVLKEPLRRHGASSSATELLSLGTSAAGSVGGFGLSSANMTNSKAINRLRKMYRSHNSACLNVRSLKIKKRNEKRELVRTFTRHTFVFITFFIPYLHHCRIC